MVTANRTVSNGINPMTSSEGTRILFTGSSSRIGACVLRRLLEGEAFEEVWCGVNEQDIPVTHSAVRQIPLRLPDEFNLDDLPAPLDLVIHFAGLTHADDDQSYWDVNFRGTMKLAEQARARGCRRFVYISTRCATAGSGPYGESKQAAEEELLRLDWDYLLILRPAEIYGAGGDEGIDKFIEMAARFHVVPLLWGHEGLRFAPLHFEDFAATVVELLHERRSGVHILDVCGPENFDGATLAWRIARRYRALPVPLWWPALNLGLHTLRLIGFSAATPDQSARLVGRKTAHCSTSDRILNRVMTRFLLD